MKCFVAKDYKIELDLTDFTAIQQQIRQKVMDVKLHFKKINGVLVTVIISYYGLHSNCT